MALKLKALEETKSFYKVELKKEDLTEKERNKFLRALKFIEGFIEREKEVGEKRKNNKFIAYDQIRGVIIKKWVN